MTNNGRLRRKMASAQPSTYMPYDVEKSGGGYKVVTKAGPHKGHEHSNKPLSKERATAQMRAIYANSGNEATGHYHRKYGRHIDSAK